MSEMFAAHEPMTVPSAMGWLCASAVLVATASSGALVPYATFRNEDSHHLRSTDPTSSFYLGPVPNIIIEGKGRGAQLDAELIHEVSRSTELGLGLRYWHLEATKGTRTVPHIPGAEQLPLVELVSERVGLLLSLRSRW